VAPAKTSLALFAALGMFLTARGALAFCRTTTCDVDMAQNDCTWDDNMCAMSGHPLFWPDSCAWFGVQQDGSARRHITYATFHSLVANAFKKWSKANCGGGTVPSFEMTDTDTLYGPIVCADREFNKNAANASVWMFRDNDWPYTGGSTTIALTTLSVDIPTGRILDADVEINSYRTNITTSDTDVVADLDSIVTHESGHFLGLAHSPVQDATMFANYSPSSITIRDLATDDQKGICTAYPPSTAPACGPPEPIYGFSRYCNGANPSTSPVGTSKTTCAVAMGAESDGRAALVVAAVTAAAVRLRRRRQV
jgi:hypothetical protein